MSLCKRLVARLDVKGNRLIKGVRFEGLRVLGDPCIAAKEYADQGIDEIFFIDAVASLYGRNSLVDILRNTSKEVFVPITAGGGVKSLEDARKLIAAGADKIAINTAALQNPKLIKEISQAFGSQCVVASIQARNIGTNRWEAMSESGREKSGIDVRDWIVQVQDLGAGEILLTSVDQDGTLNGCDQQLFESVCDVIKVPFVFGGGFCQAEEVSNILQRKQVAGVAIGNALHRKILDINTLKKYLSADMSIRPLPSLSREDLADKSLINFSLGIIDYGMGNQQSLINALTFLGADVVLSSDPSELGLCDLLFLPGVGSFPGGISQLKARNLDVFIHEWIRSNKPLIGICLGMQMLFASSNEFEETAGLAVIPGKVSRLPDYNSNSDALILPHIGWNCLNAKNADHEFVSADAYQYFVHSYAAAEVQDEDLLCECTYDGVQFTAGVVKGLVAGFQFHPERSGKDGLQLLQATIQSLITQSKIQP